MYWNILDADADHSAVTRFTKPNVLNRASLNCLHRHRMSEASRADKLENYMLVAQNGAITPFHQDASSTSVLYIQMKGCKTFYIIIATPNNQRLFDMWNNQSRRDFFFGSHPDLDAGGCQKLCVYDGQVLLMPANVIHMVETTGTSVAYGMNFIHRSHFVSAALSYATERQKRQHYGECYPYFPVLAITHIVALMRQTIVLEPGEKEIIKIVWDSLKECSKLENFILMADKDAKHADIESYINLTQELSEEDLGGVSAIAGVSPSATARTPTKYCQSPTKLYGQSPATFRTLEAEKAKRLQALQEAQDREATTKRPQTPSKRKGSPTKRPDGNA